SPLELRVEPAWSGPWAARRYAEGVDEYQREINELQTQIDAMVEAEEDPKEIAELQMQLQILQAIYSQTVRVFQAGEEDPELRRRLAMRGYGEWTLDNVYAFVFETSVDLPGQGHRSFVGEIREADFVQELVSVGTIDHQ
ncbi:MAG: hypothetical protein J2P39_09715, partial [Candidatus Dormibacteraeota bacterium]|nr:hypothetical protein [Candidatus Dormibacteraeota bacterium]